MPPCAEVQLRVGGAGCHQAERDGLGIDRVDLLGPVSSRDQPPTGQDDRGHDSEPDPEQDRHGVGTQGNGSRCHTPWQGLWISERITQLPWHSELLALQHCPGEGLRGAVGCVVLLTLGMHEVEAGTEQRAKLLGAIPGRR